jgi:hypothetical protein
MSDEAPILYERCQVTLPWNPLSNGPVKCQRAEGHTHWHRWGLYYWMEVDGRDWHTLAEEDLQR